MKVRTISKNRDEHVELFKLKQINKALVAEYVLFFNSNLH